MDEHRAALDVGEELVAEAGALGGALDQARDVGEHRLAVLAVDHPERRREGRERVVGDLRRRPGQARPAARTCRRWAGRSGRRRRAASAAARSSPPRRRCPCSAKRGAWRVELAKRLLPWPPRPPWATIARWPGLEQVDRAAVDGLPLGPRRHRDLPVLAAGPVPIRPFAMPAAARPGSACCRQRAQIPPRGIADQDDVPPVPAVTPVGPTARHMRLAPEARRTRCHPAPPSTKIFARSQH